MDYAKPDMQILIWEEGILPITQVSEVTEGDPFGDLDAGGLPEEE